MKRCHAKLRRTLDLHRSASTGRKHLAALGSLVALLGSTGCVGRDGQARAQFVGRRLPRRPRRGHACASRSDPHCASARSGRRPRAAPLVARTGRYARRNPVGLQLCRGRGLRAEARVPLLPLPRDGETLPALRHVAELHLLRGLSRAPGPTGLRLVPSHVTAGGDASIRRGRRRG
jgi:hypothetical protein